MVEAAGVEPASETTVDEELSCFFLVLNLVTSAKNGQRYARNQPDRSHPLRPGGTLWASLLCDDRYGPIGEAQAVGYLVN